VTSGLHVCTLSLHPPLYLPPVPCCSGDAAQSVQGACRAFGGAAPRVHPRCSPGGAQGRPQLSAPPSPEGIPSPSPGHTRGSPPRTTPLTPTPPPYNPTHAHPPHYNPTHAHPPLTHTLCLPALRPLTGGSPLDSCRREVQGESGGAESHRVRGLRGVLTVAGARLVGGWGGALLGSNLKAGASPGPGAESWVGAPRGGAPGLYLGRPGSVGGTGENSSTSRGVPTPQGVGVSLQGLGGGRDRDSLGGARGVSYGHPSGVPAPVRTGSGGSGSMGREAGDASRGSRCLPLLC